MLDAGIRADIAADRQEGFRTGAVQQFAAGARLIRLVLRDYATPSGAEAAYARQARYVRATLPDPSLRTSIAAVAVNGDPAVLATYTSGAGTKSYTVTTLLFRRATLVGQVNAFPAGVSDGQPARDSRDLQAIARGLISPPAS